MKADALKNIVLTLVVLIIILTIIPKEVEARDEEMDEGYFDIRVTLRFEGGEFLQPDASFDLQNTGAWVDVGLQVELIQDRGSFVEFVYLKVNGESLLFTTGSIRAHTSVYGPFLEIEAYGEAFVSYTDSYYKDSVDGHLSLSQEQIGPELFLAFGGAVILGLTLILIQKRR